MHLRPEILALLAAGKAVRARLSALRQNHNRWVAVYSAGGSSDLPRFSVVSYEVEARHDVPSLVARDVSSDYGVAYVEGIADLENAIIQFGSELEDAFVALVPNRLVIRSEPQNWRIEMDGELLASAADRPDALGFAYAAAQHFYEYDGIVPAISLLNDGIEEALPWAPDHDFLDVPED